MEEQKEKKKENESPSKKNQVDQEELFEKIKTELFGSFNQNFSKIEKDLSEFKEKVNSQKIEEMIESNQRKNQEEQRKIHEDLQRPAQMLDELKSEWNLRFIQQSSIMKDMIQNSVSDALSRRKEEKDQSKEEGKADDKV